MQTIEMTGEKFNLETYLSSQELCKKVTRRIAESANAGMSESDGQQLIIEEFKKEGITKFWHPSKFRIGAETVKSFRELPDPSVQLQKGDIFFLDIGPVIEEHEADYGQTFVHSTKGDGGSDKLVILAEASEKVWHECAAEWKTHQLSGLGLFEFADSVAQSFGCKLNPLMAGHRLGDFPHALFSKDKLFSLGIVPAKNLWVLEIHVIDPVLQKGSFFEDILS